MVIKVDVTYISDDLKLAIQDAISRNSVSDSQDNDHISKHRRIILYDENDRQKVKQLLDDILRKNQFNNYVVVDNIEEKDEIAILRKDDLEQLGIFICLHCGTLFASENERTIHQRMHYFI
jgi:uncharacterized protein CbrC (UPF0167 family)